MDKQQKVKVIKHVGNEIYQRRTALGFRQDELAAYVGLSRVNICNIEKGNNATGCATLWEICNALGCSIADLFPPNVPAKTTTKTITKTILVPTRVKVKKTTLISNK